MTEQEKPSQENWNDYAGDFIKAEHIDVFPVTLVCNKVDGHFDEDGKAHLILELPYKNKKWSWECNKTNQKFIKDAKILKPRDLNMKKLTFEKIKVRNPATKMMVDSMVITKVE